MSKPIVSRFRKTVLSASVAAALGLGMASNSLADIYEFTYANGGCGVDHAADFIGSDGKTDHTGDVAIACTGPGDAFFTMLDSGAVQLQNTSYPYYGDPTWGYGLRTQLGGKLSVDVENNLASATINGFEFYNGGAAIASKIKMKNANNVGEPTLWLANMNFDWNGSTIITQGVFDFVGLLNELPPIASAPPGVGAIFNAASCTTSGVCATPASDGIKKGKYPIGPTPVATSSFNASGANKLTTVLADLSLGTDDAIGGSPMDNGPFSGFNANFDFGALELTGYKDTTPPVITLGQNTINLTTGSAAFEALNPGTTVACTDVTDGTEDVSADTNSNITFSAPVGTVDTSTQGIYIVTYACNDNAERHGNVQDPADPENTLAAVNNNSVAVDLTVVVSEPYTPFILLNGTQAVTHEACTLYTDAGASAADPEEGGIPLVTVDNLPIDGTTPMTEFSATIDFSATDTGAGNPDGLPLSALPITRTINVVDSVNPVITLADPIVLEATQSDGFTLPTANATDCSDVDGGGVIATNDAVNFSVGSGNDSVQTTLRYIATDLSNAANQTQADLIATVYRSEPTIRMNGDAIMVLDVGDSYTELGVDIRDVQDGTLTDIKTTAASQGLELSPAIAGVTGSGILNHSVVIRDGSGAEVQSIDTSVNGTRYTVTYAVTDSAGNVAAAIIRTINIGAFAQNANFTMLDPKGLLVDGAIDITVIWDQATTTEVTSNNFNMEIVSSTPTPFKGFKWAAHRARTFSEGVYQFDTTCTPQQLDDGVTAACDNPLVGDQVERYMTLNVGPNQVGAHMLFNWGAPDPSSPCAVANCNIDVGVVWNVGKSAEEQTWSSPDAGSDKTNKLYLGQPGEIGPDPSAPWEMVSVDPDGDEINGIKMVDGPFIGFNANFNFNSLGDGIAAKPIVMTAPDTKLGSGSLSLGGLLVSLLTLVGAAISRKRAFLKK